MTLNCKVIFCGSHEVVRCIICVVLVFLEKISEKKNVTGILSWMCGLYCTIVWVYLTCPAIPLLASFVQLCKSAIVQLSKLLLGFVLWVIEKHCWCANWQLLTLCAIVAPHKRNWHVIHLMLMSQAMSKPHQCGVRRYWEMTEKRVRSTFENTRDDTLQFCACSPSLDYMYIQGVRSRFLFSEQTSNSSHAHSFWEECKKRQGNTFEFEGRVIF